MEYQLIRSARKTMAIQVKDGKVFVRVPLRAGKREIDAFVKRHAKWIEKALARSADNAKKRQEEVDNAGKITDTQIRALANAALKTIPERVRYFAPLIGVNYGRITIRNQSSRWGSCSAKGNLNFNCLLMLAPPNVLDSVVVHELCHRLEMNHSSRFYEHVYKYCPDYDECRKWLKTEGSLLLARRETS